MATKRAKAPPAPEATAPPEFDMSDPSSSSYGEGARFLRDMLDPSARITDAGAQVLHWARRLAKAGLTSPARLELARSRKSLGRAIRTLNNYDLPAEVSQAIDTLIREASHIGVIRGQHWQVLRGREGMKDARIAPAHKDKILKAKARQELEERIIGNKKSWLLKKPPLLRTAVMAQTGEPVSLSTIKRDIVALRKQRAKSSLDK